MGMARKSTAQKQPGLVASMPMPGIWLGLVLVPRLYIWPMGQHGHDTKFGLVRHRHDNSPPLDNLWCAVTVGSSIYITSYPNSRMVVSKIPNPCVQPQLASQHPSLTVSALFFPSRLSPATPPLFSISSCLVFPAFGILAAATRGWWHDLAAAWWAAPAPRAYKWRRRHDKLLWSRDDGNAMWVTATLVWGAQLGARRGRRPRAPTQRRCGVGGSSGASPSSDATTTARRTTSSWHSDTGRHAGCRAHRHGMT